MLLKKDRLEQRYFKRKIDTLKDRFIKIKIARKIDSLKERKIERYILVFLQIVVDTI